MEPPNHRRWMINRLRPGRGEPTPEFITGVEHFDAFARNQRVFTLQGVYWCPCAICKNKRFDSPDNVKTHLYRRGFLRGYWYWTSHGESEAPCDDNVNIDIHGSSSSNMDVEDDDPGMNTYETMVEDALGHTYRSESERTNLETPLVEPPNPDAQKFYDMLDAAQRPIWPGSQMSEIEAAVRLMSIKSDYNVSHNCFNEFAGLMKEACPSGNVLPTKMSEVKKIVGKLGLKAEKIDCCPNGCMLFYKDDLFLSECKFCHHPRYKPKRSKEGKGKQIPFARMHYLPIIPRLQRLFASRSSAKHMRWHHENPRAPGILCHPSDGEAWKHFDRTHTDFASEPRNVRLGLCADGFAPFSLSSKAYSCWPVILTPYNLPPELCMTTPYMFLACIIPGPHNPKSKIDVYLQPLIDDLKKLWEGVLTYDISRKENFLMKAAVMWTINDFPAYGMLSGWSTHGKLACPICMHQTKSFWLQNGGKATWFDCHRRFLPPDHPYRRNKQSFLKNKVEHDPPPIKFHGDQIEHVVSNLPKVTEMSSFKISGFGDTHNWTKQSIFWELPYWKTNLLRHNLDVMHIEKNFFDNVLNTVMDVKGKTKDDRKARLDMEVLCNRKELHLLSHNGNTLKPKAKYTLNEEERKQICNWALDLRVPDGYSSLMANCVDVDGAKLCNLKSHDCHVFMENLLPIAFSALPDQVWKPLAEISQFFKALCSTVLETDKLVQMDANIPIILCKLERIFPPGFFNCMEHLPVHLAYEAILGGPVQYRWMYPFERFLGKLKKMVKNNARPEGSICEAYLGLETSHFVSYYFEDNVPSMRTRARRNERKVQSESFQHTLSVFDLQGHPSGKSKKRFLCTLEVKAAHLHILLNCTEVQPYLDLFKQEKRAQNQHLRDEDIDSLIELEFSSWFQHNVHKYELVGADEHKYLCQMSLGPLNVVTTWPIYYSNGYKFHTQDKSAGMKTFNSGVCVLGIAEGGVVDDYYGILKDVVELEYPGLPMKKCVLLLCSI